MQQASAVAYNSLARLRALPRRFLMPLPPFSEADATARLDSLPGWRLDNNEIVREFKLHDFRAALAFVNQVGDLAEQAGHHPDIDIRYNRVRLALVTHDAGGLTENDFDLAGKVNRLESTFPQELPKK